MRTPNLNVRIGTVAGEGEVREIIAPEVREDSLDGRRASSVMCTEPAFVCGLGTSGLKVTDGRGDILPGRPKGAKKAFPLGERAGLEYGLMQRMGSGEITGELDVGHILNIRVEVLGGAIGIGVGEEI